MMETIESVCERLDLLERENRRLRWISSAFVVGACVLAVLAAVGPRRSAGTIEAQRLVIRDREGRVRGSFGVDPGGLPALKILDRRGLEQVELGVQSEDSATLLFSDRGSPRILLDTSIEGNSSFRLFDDSRTTQAGVFVMPGGATHFTMGDPDRTATVPSPPEVPPLSTGGPQPAPAASITPPSEAGKVGGTPERVARDVPEPISAEDRAAARGMSH